MARLRYILLALMLVLLIVRAESADSSKCNPLRPVESAYMVDFGSASLLDTYLTPIRYSGWHLRLGYERNQAMKFNPRRWVMQMSFGLGYDNVKNIVKNRTMHSLMVDFSWGMMHRWRDCLTRNLSLYAGGSTSFSGGAIYNQYNSNNPVSVKIRWSLNLSAMAVYDYRLGKLPITLRYQATLPVVGLFFSPDYGEAFYEIYVGNRDNLVHFGSWGNRFDMTNLLAADLHLGTTALRIGYRNTIENSWVNNLNTQIRTHSVVLGVSGEWISVGRNTNMLNKNAEIISAIY